MTTAQTTELLAEVQALIREREREGVRRPRRARRSRRVGATSCRSSSRARSPSSSSGCPTRRSRSSSRSCRRPRRRGSCARCSAPEAASCSAEMDPDDAADVVEQLPDARRPRRSSIRMRPSEAAEIRELSGYPPDSAGGIMTPGLRGGRPRRHRGRGDRRDPAPGRRGRDGQLRLRRRRRAAPARRAVAVPPAAEPRPTRRWSS